MSNLATIESSFLKQVKSHPQLSMEEEFKLAYQWRNEKNSLAAEALVLSTMWLVWSISNDYVKYGANRMDLIQEGMVGLMTAVKKFDPAKGFRLSTYAGWWIRSSMQEYILRYWRVVRPSLTKENRGIFVGLSRPSEAITVLEGSGVDEFARKSGVSKEEYLKMATYFLESDVYLSDCPECFDSVSLKETPENIADSNSLSVYREKKIEEASDVLNEREKEVLKRRFLSEDSATLAEVAADVGVSPQRVGQIEKQALIKMRKKLSKDKDFLNSTNL